MQCHHVFSSHFSAPLSLRHYESELAAYNKELV
jgi:hypothetical protein